MTASRNEDLKQYSELAPILESVKILDFGESCVYADYLSEGAIIEFGNALNILDYSYNTNWDFDNTELILDWYQNGTKRNIFTVFSFEFSTEDIKSLCRFALELDLGNLTIKAFTKFIIYLLSRMIHKEFCVVASRHMVYIVASIQIN